MFFTNRLNIENILKLKGEGDIILITIYADMLYIINLLILSLTTKNT